MIKLTKLNDKEIYLNPDLFDNIESHPNTTIMLTTGVKIIVKETPDEIVNKIVEFKRRITNK
ncbi:MAG: flagellar protein FlbD [Elusimicrobia bacterium RIFOXYC2_FULL_34_12]|nr:MAG: flagellar protein FlbD [Elusimicrobia bacterium RIFOXYC2_FULL_34_12]